jgi:hypothetical protein
MSQEIINDLEEKIRSNDTLKEENKTELLNLLSNLKAETIKDEKDPNLIQQALNSLSDSVRGFEVTHPKFVEEINFIASKLADSGI